MTKRRLSNFDFTKDSSHIALCSKTLNGGAANGYKTLIFKANGLGDDSKEAIDVLKMVTVTLSMQEFLKKFFHMYYDDAEVLSQALGFEADYDVEEYEEYQGHIESKVAQISIMKEANDSEDINKFISEVSVKDYLEILKVQSLLEDVVKSHQPHSKAVSKENKTKGANMPNENVEISKAEFDKLTKALETNEAQQAEIVELRKAKDKAAKADIQAVVKSLSFVTEDEVEGLVDVLHNARSIEKAELIIQTLDKANKAISEFVEKEHGVDAVSNDSDAEDYQKSVTKFLTKNKGEV